MARNSSEVEQAVARTLRDSLAKLQQTTGELDQAVNDLVSACASARPSNSLPPMLRARSAAASLAASLEVLSKFVITSLQSAPAPAEQELLPTEPRTAASVAPAEPIAMEPAPPVAPFVPAERIDAAAEPVELVESVETELPTEPAFTEAPPAELELAEVAAPPAEPQEWVPARKREWAEEPEPSVPFVAEELTPVLELAGADTTAPFPASYNDSEVLPPEAAGFGVRALSPEQQELHRRANRVAKVSMQDVKMLRPVDVALGKEHKDLCLRLRDDIEKAHKEYDRRFHAIRDQPVDYFYDWMVEILGDGDPEALGEYPYPSPVLRR